MSKIETHDLVKAVQEIAIELQRTPTRGEFEGRVRGAGRKLATFGGYTVLLKAAGLDTYDDRRLGGRSQPTQKQESKLLKQYKATCSKREQIQGFFRSVIDLKELFDRAGNPSVLKVSAQPDTHAKFVDRPAFNAYLQFLSYYKPHVHIILGDFVDCEGLSHWPSDDMEPRRIVPEMKTARQMLQELVDATPECIARIYCEGNHERWIEQAFTKMPELFEDLAELDIEINLKTLLALPKFGYELFPLNELVQIGRAHFSHGIYTGSNHAKKHLDTFKANFFYGHLHDLQETNQTSMEGHMEAGSLGCLCRLDAKFLKGKPNNWAHAHGVFEIFPDGTYNFYKPRIHGGKMAFNGLVFDGNG